uniref:Uncharacterized protein n=1 Tax=Anguilla anguilla TaxID=7936 RepID=A0A0E9PJH6_ANGAN
MNQWNITRKLMACKVLISFTFGSMHHPSKVGEPPLTQFMPTVRQRG